MKRIVSALIVVAALLTLCGCQRKQKPIIKIKHESVTSVDFKKAVDTEDPTNLGYVQKSVTEKQDVEDVLCWIEGLRLVKYDPIEIPVEKVNFVIVLNAIKDHKLIFMDNFVVYDGTAYTFENPEDVKGVTSKYNLLNYPETKTKSSLV